MQILPHNAHQKAKILGKHVKNELQTAFISHKCLLLLVQYAMVESNPSDPPEQKPSPAQSKDAYEEYREHVFNQLEQQQNPLLVDTEAAELMFLVLRNPNFTQVERLQEFVNVSQLTMLRMCRYIEQPKSQQSTLKQAEMIHNTYAQVFARSMVELTKLVEPHSPAE